jgi:hypothetical protein
MYAKAREKKQRFTHYVHTSIASFWRSEKDKQRKARSESKQARTPLSLSQHPDQKSRIEPSQRLFPSKRDKNEKKGIARTPSGKKDRKEKEKKKQAKKRHTTSPLCTTLALISSLTFLSTQLERPKDAINNSSDNYSAPTQVSRRSVPQPPPPTTRRLASARRLGCPPCRKTILPGWRLGTCT